MRYGPALTPSQESVLRQDTIERTAKALTVTQADAMRRVRDRGSLAWAAGKGRAGGAVARMFHRLRDAGLVDGPPYAVSEFGKRVLDAWDTAHSSTHQESP